jgi:hypothetical protein
MVEQHVRRDVRSVAAEYMGCPESDVAVSLVAGSYGGRRRAEYSWSPKVYCATGCGRGTTVRCPEWDSYDQKPVCHAE